MSEPYWIALGAAGAVDHKGDWAAGTQYLSGDVVRLNGIDYLAVNPSLGQTPPLAAVGAGVELAYAQITADVAVPVVAEAAAVPVTTMPSMAFDGSPILIEFYSPLVTVGAAPAYVLAILCDGATILGIIGQASVGLTSMYAARRLVPTVASHTYNIKAYATVNAGTIRADVGGTGGLRLPAFMRMVKV